MNRQICLSECPLVCPQGMRGACGQSECGIYILPYVLKVFDRLNRQIIILRYTVESDVTNFCQLQLFGKFGYFGPNPCNVLLEGSSV